jgi:hypothetical protein
LPGWDCIKQVQYCRRIYFRYAGGALSHEEGRAGKYFLASGFLKHFLLTELLLLHKKYKGGMMMCHYCGHPVSDDSINMLVNDITLPFCDEECILHYYQERQETHFQSWVSFR